MSQIITGSSPLARGTPSDDKIKVWGGGLIPARAGNTTPERGAVPPRRAHPRSRGEHGVRGLFQGHLWGSSPLARGTLASTVNVEARAGLIPARAGNTVHYSRQGGHDWAHPRSRGEHCALGVLSVAGRGSSPLARGTHLLTWGFTPYISKIESLWSQSLHPEYTINNCS